MPTFSHIAGDRMLDLINTVEWRLGGPERIEDLTSYGSVVTWCQESGLLLPSEGTRLTSLSREDPQRATFERDEVVALRERAYKGLFEGSQAAADALAAAYRDGIAQAHLVPGDGGWVWSDDGLDLATPRHRIARGLVQLMGRPDLDRLHQCEDAICGWVYLDTSPRRNRRWCVTKDCGDRNRSRAYYARKRSRAATPMAGSAREDQHH